MSDAAADVVFLFDVDNTLLDNDRIRQDLRDELVRCCGPEARDRYWAILDELRESLGYVDYLGALERYRLEHVHDPRVLRMANWLIDYPFADRLYPGALAVLERVEAIAPAVILSDGDAVFQPRKVARSGLQEAVQGQVLIYVHKEAMLDDVARLHPAKRYVMVDDKLPILAAMKATWGPRLTTVFVRQGHYAVDPAILRDTPPADTSIDRIADLLHADLARLAASGASPA